MQLQYGCSILRYRAASTTEPACTSELDFFGGAEVSNAVRRLASLQHALQASEDARLLRPVRQDRSCDSETELKVTKVLHRFARVTLLSRTKLLRLLISPAWTATFCSRWWAARRYEARSRSEYGSHGLIDGRLLRGVVMGCRWC